MNKKLERIVYVDDEPDIREIARFVLEDFGGYEVELYSSGVEAIEGAPRFKPDLILLDVMMPEMDGIETLKRLSAMPQLDGVPVVFITAKAMPQEGALYRTLGVADVISKPFDPMELAERIETIWRDHRELQESA